MLAYFETERGFSIDDLVKLITGTGAPGTSGDSTTVGVGSIYMDQTGGGFHKKITAGSGTNKWEELGEAGDISALQTEVNSIETSVGLDSDGTYTAPSGTNHIDGATSVRNESVLLDTEIGADVTAVSRTTSPIVNGSAVNTNIDNLDSAIGADSDLTSTSYVSTANTLMANLAALDAGITTAIDGIDSKESCRLATDADLDTIGNGTWVQVGAGEGATLTAGTAGTTTIDSVVVANGDRVLVKDQGTGAENGIYVVSDAGVGSATILTRATDFDGTPANEVSANAFTFIEEGTGAADKGYVLTTNDPITVDTTALSFSVFSSAGGLGALQTEVDSIETSLGTSVNSNGTYAGHSSTNHIDGATSVTSALELLDTEIGANVVAVSRTNNPIVNGDPLNDNIDSLDAAIGADSELTPVSRTTGPLVVNTTVMSKFDAVDTYLGNDVSPTTRTVGPIVAANDLGANLEALDTAVGTDAQLTALTRTVGTVATSQSVNQNIDDLDAVVGADSELTAVSRTAGPISTSQTIYANIDDLDAAIGVDVTSTNFAVAASAVNANISNLDSKIGGNLSDGQAVLAVNSIMANLTALDEALDSVGVQVATSVTAATITTIDTVLVDDILSTKWLVHVQDGTNFEVMVVEAVHDNIPAGADASNTDHTVYAKLRIGAVSGIAITVDLNGATTSQEMRLRITTTNSSEVTVMRFGVEA